MRTPRFSTQAEFAELYDELLACARATHWTVPDAAVYAMGHSRERTDKLFEISDVLWVFADIYNLLDDDTLDHFAKFTYGIMIWVLDSRDAHSAILSALLNARDTHAKQTHE